MDTSTTARRSRRRREREARGGIRDHHVTSRRICLNNFQAPGILSRPLCPETRHPASAASIATPPYFRRPIRASPAPHQGTSASERCDHLAQEPHLRP
jgi:hypothetical protein